MDVSTRVKGHMENTDPRDLYRGSMGCIWPTVPNAKWYANCASGAGVLDYLEHEGVLLEEFLPAYSETTIVWRGSEPSPSDLSYVLYKTCKPDRSAHRWGANILSPTKGNFIWLQAAWQPDEMCNKTWMHTASYFELDNPFEDWGRDLRFTAVEHDQEKPPPDQWPYPG